MRTFIAIAFLLPLLAIAQDSDFRRQIQTTTYTRNLLTSTNSAEARVKLEITGTDDLVILTATNLAELSALSLASLPGSGEIPVAVLGYSSPGDWGEQRFARRDATSVASTNLGCVFATSEGTGRWIFDDCFNGGRIDARWFGVFSGTNSIGEVTRNTDGLRTALAFTDSIFNGRPEIVLPAGMIFTDGNITNEATPMRGSSWLDFTGGSTWHGTVLRLNRGSTNDLLTCS